jgi:hypothetical protein
VNLRVLAHLELGEVEAVGLDLPDEVLQAAVGVARGPGLGERGLQGAQFVEQFFGRGVAEVGVARARGFDAARDEQQHAAVRLVGRALRDIGRDVFVDRLEPLPQSERPIRSAVRASPRNT